ncbi:MAG: hypothetical protein ACUVXI_17370 [bacterium]
MLAGEEKRYFDNIPQNRFWKLMERCGVPDGEVSATRNVRYAEAVRYLEGEIERLLDKLPPDFDRKDLEEGLEADELKLLDILITSYRLLKEGEIVLAERGGTYQIFYVSELMEAMSELI